MLTIIDGCPGLVKAVHEVYSELDVQRCTKHKTKGVLDKVLKQDREDLKESVRFYVSTYEHDLEAVELFKKNWSRKYRSAMECLLEDIEACLRYYKYPYQRWRRIRTTNVVERGFREVKGRTKGIWEVLGRGAGVDEGLLAVEGIEVAWGKDDRRG